MVEKIEIYKHIYQDSDMSVSTIKELKKDLKNKDNKIKDILDYILKEFIKYRKHSKKILLKNKVSLEEEGFIVKMMANMGIKKEVVMDNSDSHMADLLIQGISMGSINIEQKISNYKDSLSFRDLRYAKKFYKFEKEIIEELKKYL